MQGIDENNEFMFRLYGDGITPESFKASEVAKLITLLENAFQVYLQTTGEESDKDFYLSLVDVKNESLGLEFLPQKVKSFLTAFTLITSSINTQNFTEIPTKTIEDFQEIQKIIKAKNCAAEFIYKGESRASIDSNTLIEIPKTGVIRGETVLYGEVKRIGGQNPTASIKLDSGETITCSISKNVAKKLGAKIYSHVSLRGLATWSVTDYNLLGFIIEDFNDFQQISNEDAFNRLRNSIGTYWDSIEDIDSFLLRA